jgi:hypothetical protein
MKKGVEVDTTKGSLPAAENAFSRKDFLWMEDKNEWHLNREE